MSAITTTDHITHLIGGAWVPTRGTDTIAVTNPATERVIAHVPAGTAADADAAVSAARAAFPSWAATPLAERIAIVGRIIDGLRAAAPELVDRLVEELGVPTPIAESMQIGMGIGMAGTFMAFADQIEAEEHIGNSVLRRVPAGVVVAITPWNVPLLMTMQKVVPALLAGCTVVHKPSELTPLHSYLVADVVHRSGLPAGVYNMVMGAGPQIGAALAGHPDIDVVSLTGSTRAGRDVARRAAPNITAVHLELGGKSANIVLDGADLATAVRAGVDQVCFNSGQACLQWSRMLVPRRHYDDAADLATQAMSTYQVGDPRAEGTDLGPVISAVARQRIRAAITSAVAEGARVAIGGPRAPAGLDSGYYVSPTTLVDVDNGMDVARTEIFGPVLSLIPYDSEDDAVRIANDSPYGLHGAVWGEDVAHALTVAHRLRTGLIDINGAPFNPLAPFGGFRHSGVGRECGIAGIRAYQETTAIQLPDDTALVAGPKLRGR